MSAGAMSRDRRCDILSFLRVAPRRRLAWFGKNRDQHAESRPVALPSLEAIATKVDRHRTRRINSTRAIRPWSRLLVTLASFCEPRGCHRPAGLGRAHDEARFGRCGARQRKAQLVLARPHHVVDETPPGFRTGGPRRTARACLRCSCRRAAGRRRRTLRARTAAPGRWASGSFSDHRARAGALTSVLSGCGSLAGTISPPLGVACGRHGAGAATVSIVGALPVSLLSPAARSMARVMGERRWRKVKRGATARPKSPRPTRRKVLCRRARYRTRSPSRSPARRQRGARNRR
jgi:hypothetical protein